MTFKTNSPEVIARGLARGSSAKSPIGAVLLLGSPGVGKGTQAKELSRLWNIPRISTGDQLRNHVAHGTPLGRRVKAIMERGELVPDSLITEMVKSRLLKPDTRRGYILDGFPRTIDQANWLIERLARPRSLLPIFAVRIYLSRTQLLRRITGRRHCPVCQTSFHIYDNRPKREGLCDRDDTVLIQRPDDTEEVLGRRLVLHDALTAPVIRYFQTRGQFADVTGDGPIEWITGRIIEAVDTLSLPGETCLGQLQ